ncbi:MAG: GTP-binding protein HSR1 [Thermotoga sp.]|nr:MAG: GTP-binding protein HSR1 [Thermotoga sp.]
MIRISPLGVDNLPANLPPEYKRTEEKLRRAKTIEEKIEIVQKLIALLPKHKGTDKLYADLKRKLSKLKEMAEEERRKTARYDPFLIKKSGAGQVVLLGFPNSGKSSILKALTNSNPEIADFPFTTVKPNLGMMEFENVQIQLVDLPPIHRGHVDPLMMNAVRRSDGMLLIFDAGNDEILDEYEYILKVLRERKIEPYWDRIEDEMDVGWIGLRAMIVVNKMDRDYAEERFEMLMEFVNSRFPVVPISVVEGRNLEELKRKIFELLDIVRVYSKRPGKPPDYEKPFVLRRGSTVLDLAEEIHKEFSKKLKGAKLWDMERRTYRFVERNYEMKDGDVIELVI